MATPPQPLPPELLQRFDALNARFDERFRYDQTKETLVDRMHEEIRRLRNEAAGRALRPFVDGVLRLRRDIERAAADLGPAPDPASFAPLLQSFVEQATDLLASEGIDAFTHPEERFDGRVQRAVGSEPAPSPDRVGCVARRMHPGFRSTALLYERESVLVYGPVRATETPR